LNTFDCSRAGVDETPAFAPGRFSVRQAAFLIGLVSLLSSSCAREAKPTRPAEAPIVTDRERYELQPGPFGYEGTIVASFTAPKDTTAYIVHCNGAISWGLQRLVEGRWDNAWVAVTNACLSPPIVVPGNGAYTDTLTIVSSGDQGAIEPGMYRVAWFNILTSFDPEARPFGEELPIERRVSKPIAIDLAPAP